MGAARLVRCLLACLARLASAENSLVGPDAVGSYQGPSHGRSNRGFTHEDVYEAPAGFLVAGSSIRAMNGLYARVEAAEAGKLPDDRKYPHVYRHDYTGWHMVLSVLPKPRGKRLTEWLFIDNDGEARFAGEGGTLTPSPGEYWHHVHRAKAGQPDMAAGTAVAAAAPEDDLEELPWQLVGLLSQAALRDLRRLFRHYKHNVQEAVAGGGLPALPPADSPETAPPETLQLPNLLEGEAAREACLEGRRGDVQQSLEQSAQAGDTWTQAVVLLFVAKCHRQERNFHDAESSLLASLELKPRYKDAILEQGLNRLDAERYPDAIHSFEVLLRVDREHESVLDWLVRAHAHLRRREANKNLVKVLTEAHETSSCKFLTADRQLRAQGPLGAVPGPALALQATIEAHETPHCKAWRQTAGCDPKGPREPSQDLPCGAKVPRGASGFCECKASGAEGGAATAGAKSCRDLPLTCASACLQRWGRKEAWLAGYETAHCRAWRATRDCDPEGRRKPTEDLNCLVEVSAGNSGFCECKGSAGEGATAIARKSSCSHAPFTCADACREMYGGKAAAGDWQGALPCEKEDPPDWCSDNHYAVLGMPCDLPPGEQWQESEELRRAYKRRSLQLHPDKPGGHAQAFQRVAEAHAVLADAARRAAFDDGEDLERGVGRDGTRSPPHREVIERKYFPEDFDFQPLGDPHADRKERQAYRQRRLEQRRQEQLVIEATREQLREEMLAGAAKEAAHGEEL